MRVLPINPRGGLDFCPKDFALILTFAQQPGQMAVARIKHKRAVTQPFAPQAQQQRRDDFTFVWNSSISGIPASRQCCGSPTHAREQTTRHRAERWRDPVPEPQRRRPYGSRSCPDGYSIGAPRQRTYSLLHKRRFIEDPGGTVAEALLE